MRLCCVSDLHLEFGALDKKFPEVDVLLLAGDTTVVHRLDPKYQDAASRSLQKATRRLHNDIRAKCKRAFAILGNHEAYGSAYHEAADALRAALPEVRVLDCDHVHLSDDIILFGAPLWTDMNKGNLLSMQSIKNGMTDFRLIQGRGGHPFTPQAAADEFHKAVAYLKALSENDRSKTIIAMTHHAPSRLGLSQHNRDYPTDLDGAYYSDLDEFILDHPNIRLWHHGHSHIRKRYTIGQCQVISNARGYHGHEPLAHSFDPAWGLIEIPEKTA